MYSEILSSKGPKISGNPIENVTLSIAQNHDIDFIIEAIIESEKSGSQVISTCKVFGINEEEYKNILREILKENIGDYEYDLSGYLIAKQNDEYIGASGSWIEYRDGISSGLIKTSMLTQYLGKDRIEKMNKNIHLISALTLTRENLTFQLEHVYIREKFRKQGMFSILIKENIKRNLLRFPFTKVQTILFKDNFTSFYAHLKLGFIEIETKVAEDNTVLDFFPYNSKTLMELDHNKILNL